MQNVAHVVAKSCSVESHCSSKAIDRQKRVSWTGNLSSRVQFDCPAAAAGYRGYIGLAGNLCANHWFRLLLRFFLTLFLVSSGKVWYYSTGLVEQTTVSDRIAPIISAASYLHFFASAARERGQKVCSYQMSISAGSFFATFADNSAFLFPLCTR